MSLYLKTNVESLVPRVIGSKGMDYWESGMDLHLGDDLYDSFSIYQQRILQEYDAMKRVQLGTEYLFGNVEEKSNVLALRGGYQLSFPNRDLGAFAGLTLGIGYSITRSIVLDYAFLPADDLGASHRLSATFKFNSPGKKG